MMIGARVPKARLRPRRWTANFSSGRSRNSLPCGFQEFFEVKSAVRLGVWLKDAHQSGLYAVQRFVRTLRRDVDPVRNALTSAGATARRTGKSTA